MASEAILKTRAMDTKAYVVRSSYGCPADLPWKAGMMFGQSCIVHPDGAILGNAGHYEGLALAHTPVPFSPSLEDTYIPSPERIATAVRETMAY